MRLRDAFQAALITALLPAGVLHAAEATDQRPDLSGTYDTATMTPLERPKFLGEIKHLFPWVARTLNWAATTAFNTAAETTSDPDREAPPVGGDGFEAAGAGGVGGYNAFYIDPGTTAFQINGMYRTSIIVDPPNGRMPDRTPRGAARVAATA
ncbi:MAG: hypothetical protein P8Y69_17555, partial [Gammaproteobacteria bacterium]